jgi:methionyl-tRNA formyltransferase
MRLIFAGTPDFARVALAHLHAQGHEIALVLTQPDRPAGRGLKLQPSPVKQFAQEHGLPVAQPRSLRLDGKYPEDARDAQAQIEAARADAMIVAAYGLILPQWVLDAMRTHGLGLGCLNIHASLLPRWRGAAPIHRAIEAGDATTGVAIMQMDAGLDTGDVLRVGELPIAEDDTTGSLHDRLAELGGHLMAEVLAAAAQGRPFAPVPQPEAGVCYAHKIDKAEAQIDWTLPAATLARRVRAFNPFPGAQTRMADGGDVVKLWQAHVSPEAGTAALPGEIVRADAQGIVVACGARGDERLVLTQLQRAGGKRLAAADFLRGFALVPGQRFAAVDAPGAGAGR